MSYQLGSMDTDQRAELFAETREHDARPGFRVLIATVVALVVMALFAGGLWFAYMLGVRHASVDSGSGDVPLIRADERPTKVKPEKPGGMEVPDRDKMIYTQKHAAVEHLLPPPEKPMPRPATPPTPAAQPESPQPPAASIAALPALASPAAPPSQAPVAQEQSGAKLPAKAPSTGAAPAKPTIAQPQPAKAGGTRIQLGSVRSEEAARQEWDRLKRANADLLGSLAAIPIRADLGEKGIFYRIQTAPIADADRICSELKQRNIGCIIAR
jgi:SPOR domain